MWGHERNERCAVFKDWIKYHIKNDHLTKKLLKYTEIYFISIVKDKERTAEIYYHKIVNQTKESWEK